MTPFTRLDDSVLGRWWWSVDRWLLGAVLLLMGFGALLTLAASPAVAERLDLNRFYLANRHFMHLPAAVALVLLASLPNRRWIARMAAVGLVVFVPLLALTLLSDAEIKGSTRWLTVAGMSLQPSEFVKPFFTIATAWLLTAQRLHEGIPGNLLALMLLGLILGLLVMQPDMGQTVIIGAIWLVQFFVAGLSLTWVAVFTLLGLTGIGAAYVLLPHVSRRIDAFLDPAGADRYQIDHSLESFRAGGLFGRGPGEGIIKADLPDAHSDFVFAVAGEELGLIVCLLLVALFAFVVVRGLAAAFRGSDLFTLLAVTGLVGHFGLQALINLASTLALIPTKGMTLPFVSYGGSSLLALSIAMGLVLALTRRRHDPGDWR